MIESCRGGIDTRWKSGRDIEHWGEWLIDAFTAEMRGGMSVEAVIELLRVVDEAIESIPISGGSLDRYSQSLRTTRALRRAVWFLRMGMSKGLTVEASIIIGAEEGIVPDPRGTEDEERRLLYVGLTRAKRFSYVTWATRRTGPTARAGTPQIQNRRRVSPLLRGGPVETQIGQTYVRTRW